MGEVYLAEDTRLKRRVALKRISPQLRNDPRLLQRFHREVELASRLSHPHIASVYDVFEHDGETFIVMEYVEGHPLRRRLHGKPFAEAEFLDIAMQCASALIAAHENGVLHRDLKPENILITRDGQVKILDFGLAKDLPRSAESTLGITEPGLKGTPGYMAPEALLEKPTDARADLFSVGIVFYEMLSGRHPFLRRGDSFVTTVNRVIGETPKPVRSLRPKVSPELASIVERLLAKDPGARYQSARALAVDLKALAGGSGISATRSTVSVRNFRRPSWRTIAAVAVLVTAAAGGFLAYRHFTRPVVTTNDAILLANFSNQSGQPLFDDTVTQALRDALEQSRRVRLVSRAQAIAAAELIGKKDVRKIDASLGRQICLRDNYRGLLTGEIRSLPPDYIISIKLEDPVEGTPVYSDQVTFRRPAELYPAIDRLAHQLRKNLGESLAEIRSSSAPLAKVTTPSLEALQRYTRGLQSFDDGRYNDALGLFNSAVADDPDFAMAHLYLAKTYEMLGNLPSETAEMNKALAGIDHVSEKEKYLIEAVQSEYEDDYVGAVSQFRLLTQIYPNDLDGWKGLGNSARFAGLPSQAIRAERRILQLSPDNGADYTRLIHLLATNGAPEEAIGVYQSAVKRGISSPGLHREAGISYMVLGDLSSASKQFDLCAASGDLYGQNLRSLYQSNLLLYQGKVSEAIAQLKAGLVLDIKQGSRAWAPVRQYLLGEAYLAQGKIAPASELARQLGQTASRLRVAEFFAFAGDLALRTKQHRLAQQALQGMAALRAQRPNASIESGTYDYLRGAIQLADNHPSAAIDSELRAYAFSPEPSALHVEAQAYAARKQWDKAAAAYRDYLSHAGHVFDYQSALDWALAHLELARSLAHSGDAKQALRAYDDFLKFWSAADPNLPALRQARTERARIASSSTLRLPDHPSSSSLPRGGANGTEKAEQQQTKRTFQNQRKSKKLAGLYRQRAGRTV